MNIQFRKLHPSLKIPSKSLLNKWLIECISHEGFILGKLSYTFLTDQELLVLNREFLNHDTLTDVITFDYNQNNIIIGEIYISLDRVLENSTINNVDFSTEILRIIIHGLLHLFGYKDKMPQQKIEMTTKEDYYLSLLP